MRFPEKQMRHLRESTGGPQGNFFKQFPVIDFHSHSLPAMDDGSRDVEMSLEMLRWERRDGVDLVLATPHYYADQESIPSFLRRREHAWKQLKEHWSDELPRVLLGAEVSLSSSLRKQGDLKPLCMTGTRVLLLEMPFRQWENYDLNVLMDLTLGQNLQVVLAHLERYWDAQRDPSIMKQILKLPVSVQINAGSLSGPFWNRRPLQLFRDNIAHVLGSDCHNTFQRPPNLKRGREILQEKLGRNILYKMDSRGAELLGLHTKEVEHGQ